LDGPAGGWFQFDITGEQFCGMHGEAGPARPAGQLGFAGGYDVNREGVADRV
jgi:hypothetical protein